LQSEAGGVRNCFTPTVDDQDRVDDGLAAHLRRYPRAMTLDQPCQLGLELIDVAVGELTTISPQAAVVAAAGARPGALAAARTLHG
jgi:hypothetical protein